MSWVHLILLGCLGLIPRLLTILKMSSCQMCHPAISCPSNEFTCSENNERFIYCMQNFYCICKNPYFCIYLKFSLSRIIRWALCSLCVYFKSLQSCLTLCDPMDCSTLGSSVHGILQAKNTGVGCWSLLQGIFPTQGLNSCLLRLLHWQAGFFFFFFLKPVAPPGKLVLFRCHKWKHSVLYGTIWNL